MTKHYAGIGSRETPKDILHLMTAIATRLAADGWTLRSGHADGADLAFEVGAGKDCEIYLPKITFNGHYPIQGRKFAAPTLAAVELASQHHPAWERCNEWARLLHGRNMHQVLGYDLNDPVRFVICWAPLDNEGKPRGGTAQAIRLADSRNIPVFNLINAEHRERLTRFVAPVNGVAA